MEEIHIWLLILATHLKSDPLYSFLVDAVPFSVVAMFSAMSAQLNSKCKITARGTLGAMSSAVIVGFMTSALSKEVDLKIHWLGLIAIFGGMKSKQFIDIVSVRVIKLLKRLKW